MIRKIFNLIPKGIRERIKIIYYNYKVQNFSFTIENGNYKTVSHEGWSIFTGSPLYFIVKDVQRYEKFFQPGAGNIIIDAGANEGVLSLIYSKKIKETGHVYAFEPDDKNIIAFQKNLRLNTAIENISLIENGLWKNKDIIDFYEVGSVGSSVFYHSNNAIKRKIMVISIDEFVKQRSLPKLDFIKMDIEGAEIEAVYGAIKTIKLFRPDFAIASYHTVNDELTYLKLESFFKKIEYPYKTIFFKDGEIITYAGDCVSRN